VELQPGVRPVSVPRRLATLELSYRTAGAAPPRSLAVPATAFVASWNQASPALRLEALAAELADVLARRKPADHLPALLARARELAPAVQGTPRAARLDELIELIGRASRLLGT
ncbi:MAG TPA: hypothetical protein VGE98_01565, partial [Thermoanaerobaculia bacterium]